MNKEKSRKLKSIIKLLRDKEIFSLVIDTTDKNFIPLFEVSRQLNNILELDKK